MYLTVDVRAVQIIVAILSRHVLYNRKTYALASRYMYITIAEKMCTLPWHFIYKIFEKIYTLPSHSMPNTVEEICTLPSHYVYIAVGKKCTLHYMNVAVEKKSVLYRRIKCALQERIYSTIALYVYCRSEMCILLSHYMYIAGVKCVFYYRIICILQE